MTPAGFASCFAGGRHESRGSGDFLTEPHCRGTDGESYARILRRCGGRALGMHILGSLAGTLDGFDVPKYCVIHADTSAARPRLARESSYREVEGLRMLRKVSGSREAFSAASCRGANTSRYESPVTLHPGAIQDLELWFRTRRRSTDLCLLLQHFLTSGVTGEITAHASHGRLVVERRTAQQIAVVLEYRTPNADLELTTVAAEGTHIVTRHAGHGYSTTVDLIREIAARVRFPVDFEGLEVDGRLYGLQLRPIPPEYRYAPSYTSLAVAAMEDERLLARSCFAQGVFDVTAEVVDWNGAQSLKATSPAIVVLTSPVIGLRGSDESASGIVWLDPWTKERARRGTPTVFLFESEPHALQHGPSQIPPPGIERRTFNAAYLPAGHAYALIGRNVRAIGDGYLAALTDR